MKVPNACAICLPIIWRLDSLHTGFENSSQEVRSESEAAVHTTGHETQVN